MIIKISLFHLNYFYAFLIALYGHSIEKITVLCYYNSIRGGVEWKK